MKVVLLFSFQVYGSYWRLTKNVYGCKALGTYTTTTPRELQKDRLRH
jgi:hypothetical protein